MTGTPAAIDADALSIAASDIAILVLLPMLGAREWLVHAVGLPGVAGRVHHAIGFSRSAGKSFGRVAGMLLTTSALVIGALSLLVYAWR
ncbi:MAG: MAPEG family protein [Methylobacterium sp.]|nr:MAPEG family protein [Methylobacterium sp.]MCA3639180.1 MAPEG family protein [Methylobacterium sp.]MCA3646327.1 MAPEG family protein [Methylobacterium sp.]MCA3651303.1 MAPEG family protein [Methylobacterium sp.]MCA4921484.1 MAPEG family protein [Methylobacterium sp.]